MTDDGVTATGGLRGITEDTPEQAGAPGEAGGIDGVSAAGARTETYDVGETWSESQASAEGEGPGQADREAAEGMNRMFRDGMPTGARDAATDTSDL
ncbi:hypothetical protein [Deinococcus aluminii]